MLARSSAVTFLMATGTVFVFCFALALASFRLQYGHHTIDSAGRCRSVQEKVELGLELDSPKIVFIGGSSVHWGINAEEAGRALRRQGLNFGTFAALGPELILWEARKVLNRGDVAVLAFEYNMYSERRLTSDAISYALGCEQSFLTAMTPAQFVRTALASDPSRPFQVLRWSLRTAGDEAAIGPLARSEHGDPAASSFRDASSDIQERLKLYQPLTIRVEEDSALSRAIEKFGVWAAGHGVSVYATWPNTIAFDAYKDDPAFNEIRTLYAGKGIKLLGDPQVAMYPAALFHDTQYHLSRAGIEKRTRDLLAVLIDELADEPSKPTASAEATFSGTSIESLKLEPLPNQGSNKAATGACNNG
jgi:hypothetical protein